MAYTIVVDKFFAINLVTAILHGLAIIGWAHLRFPDKCHGSSWYIFSFCELGLGLVQFLNHLFVSLTVLLAQKVKIVGALLAIFTSSPSAQSIATLVISDLVSWLGLVFLTTAPLGVLRRVAIKAKRNLNYERFAFYVTILAVLGIIPAFIGVVLAGLDYYSTTSLTSVGPILFRIAAMILLVSYVLSVPLTALLVWDDLKKKKMIKTEAWALRGVTLSIPFFLVRFGYEAIAAFSNTTWSFTQYVVRVQVMEYCVLVINLAAAFVCYQHRSEVRKPSDKDIALAPITHDTTDEDTVRSRAARRDIIKLAEAAVRDLPHNIGPASSGAFWFTDADSGLPASLLTMIRSEHILKTRHVIASALAGMVAALPMSERNGVVMIDHEQAPEQLRVAAERYHLITFGEPEEVIVAITAVHLAILRWKVMNRLIDEFVR